MHQEDHQRNDQQQTAQEHCLQLWREIPGLGLRMLTMWWVAVLGNTRRPITGNRVVLGNEVSAHLWTAIRSPGKLEESSDFACAIAQPRLTKQLDLRAVCIRGLKVSFWGKLWTGLVW